jgi:hypothetical protein
MLKDRMMKIAFRNFLVKIKDERDYVHANEWNVALLRQVNVNKHTN